MRVAIVGSRTFNDYDKLSQFMFKFFPRDEISQVISGGAQGTDQLAERFADAEGIEKLIFPADWDKYGKSAGPRRNAQIVEAADVVVIFWDLKSPGSKNCMDQALKAGKPVMVVPVL